MTISRNHFSRRLQGVTITAALAVVMSSPAWALPTDASGTLDLNDAGLPRLAPDSCYAVNGVNAIGSANFPVRFRLSRDGNPVTADVDTTWFQANNSTFSFQPGTYQLVAVNRNPARPARIMMSLNCQ